MLKRLFCSLVFALSLATVALAQSVNSGTVIGTVSDPSAAVIAGAKLQLHNAITGYDQSTLTDPAGAFRFNNVPQDNYQLTVSAKGFSTKSQNVSVRSTLPLNVNVTVEMAEELTTVEVSSASPLLDADPMAHTDADSATFSKLPMFDPAAGLSGIINNSIGGTASDANGFFHPLGDHAQVSFIVDGQPISDQQSKVFSTQLPANAIQSMQLITGAPDAQYGDKSSLVVNATTKSGLGSRPFGSVETNWGSFGTWAENATLGVGTATVGNFVALNSIRTAHFLDTPEFLPIHDIGNNETLFDRIDFQPGVRNAFHLNLFAARNWFQVPNSLDQLPQDQKQRVMTWSVAPGYQHMISTTTLLTISPYVRRDQVNYYASRDPLHDTPVTESQIRFLTNYGIKADLSSIHGRHNLRLGTQIQQTSLLENFSMAVTDPAFVSPGLLPYNLTLGGTYFQFHGAGNINQYAFYLSLIHI